MTPEIHGVLFQRELQPDCTHTSRNTTKKTVASRPQAYLEYVRIP